MKPLFFIIVMVWGAGSTLFAQIKYEQESRVKPDEVPQSAQHFITHCFPTQKIKWYQEQSQRGTSFEAKLKRGDQRFSIEFDSNGQIEDVEWKVKLKELASDHQAQIQQGLAREFDRYRIKKIQVQWTGSEQALKELILESHTHRLYALHYEIVLKGKRLEGRTEVLGKKQYEVLLTPAGELRRIDEIRPANPDNLYY